MLPGLRERETNSYFVPDFNGTMDGNHWISRSDSRKNFQTSTLLSKTVQSYLLIEKGGKLSSSESKDLFIGIAGNGFLVGSRAKSNNVGRGFNFMNPSLGSPIRGMINLAKISVRDEVASCRWIYGNPMQWKMRI